MSMVRQKMKGIIESQPDGASYTSLTLARQGITEN